MYNPFLSEEESRDIITAVLIIMMCANRLSQINMALNQVGSVRKSLRSLKNHFSVKSPSDPNYAHARDVYCKELLSSSLNLAATLAARREFVTQDDSGFEVDPRFMIFEFSHNLLLRKPQVVLVRKLLSEMAASRSVCHQMIMGAGKTTVIGPLLAMLLADSNTLMVEVPRIP
jgi:hypothetical protein